MVIEMKKIIWLLCILLIGGCQKEDPYQQKLEAIQTATDFQFDSDHFKIALKVTSLENNRYRYDVIINEPKIAMEQIQAIAFCNQEEGNVSPSIGFLADDVCHLVPNQIDKANHYFAGIDLSGVATKATFEVKVWVSYLHENQIYEEYIMLRSDDN